MISRSDSAFRINQGVKQIKINVDADRNVFNLQEWVSDSVDVNIRLKESSIKGVTIDPRSKVGTLSIQGSTAQKVDKMSINYPGRCDSLLINLTGFTGLHLSKLLSGKFEDINISDDTVIKREE